MAKDRVVPVRLDDECVAAIDLAIARWEHAHAGVTLTRSEFFRMCVQEYLSAEVAADRRKRKGKVVCSGCKKRIWPAEVVVLETLLDGTTLRWCSTCAPDRMIL